MNRLLEKEASLKEKLPDFDIYYFESIDSTNQKAKKMLREKIVSSDTILLATEQTAGKGRLGRTWSSKRGAGLYVSLIKEVNMDRSPALMTIVAGIAVYRALESLDVANLGIKWPNDIVIGKKKLCGILSELVEVDGEFFAIIGIGINVKNVKFPDDLLTKATSLYLENIEVDMEELLRRVVISFLEVYTNIIKYGNLGHFKEFLNDKLVNVGKELSFVYEGSSRKGVAKSINLDGSLKIWTGEKYVDISSGECTMNDFYN